jgi:hypothetical protein
MAQADEPAAVWGTITPAEAHAKAVRLHQVRHEVATAALLENPEVFGRGPLLGRLVKEVVGLAKGGEWEKPLKAAVKDKDSVPWLAFADWCAEHKPEWEAVARYVGQRYAAKPKEE